MPLSKASRSALARSGGTPGVEAIERPISEPAEISWNAAL